MKSIFKTPHFTSRPKVAVTVGIFDGVHRGHRVLLRQLCKQASKDNLKTLVVTFSPHPDQVFQRKFSGVLTSDQEKLLLLKKFPIDYVWIIKFTRQLYLKSGFSFLRYLYRYFNIQKVVVGPDCHFGYARQMGIRDLQKASSTFGFSLSVVEKEKINGTIIASSRIRSLIEGSQFDAVRNILGRPYMISGRVLRGRHLGKKMFVPTVNLACGRQVTPLPGVFVVMVKHKNKMYRGVASLGYAPTIKPAHKQKKLEVFIFRFHKNIYRQKVEVYFLKRLRPERRFRSRAILKKSILKDILSARSYFS